MFGTSFWVRGFDLEYSEATKIFIKSLIFWTTNLILYIIIFTITQLRESLRSDKGSAMYKVIIVVLKLNWKRG